MQQDARRRRGVDHPRAIAGETAILHLTLARLARTVRTGSGAGRRAACRRHEVHLGMAADLFHGRHHLGVMPRGELTRLLLGSASCTRGGDSRCCGRRARASPRSRRCQHHQSNVHGVTWIILGQGPAVGFRSDGTQSRDPPGTRAHRHAGVAHRIHVTGVDPAGEKTQREGARGRDEASDVIAKRRSRAAQTRREELREIDGVAAKERELAGPHQRNHPEDVVQAVEVPEGEGGHAHRGDKRDRKGLPPPDPGREVRKRVHAAERADVLLSEVTPSRAFSPGHRACRGPSSRSTLKN